MLLSSFQLPLQLQPTLVDAFAVDRHCIWQSTSKERHAFLRSTDFECPGSAIDKDFSTPWILDVASITRTSSNYPWTVESLAASASLIQDDMVSQDTMEEFMDERAEEYANFRLWFLGLVDWLRPISSWCRRCCLVVGLGPVQVISSKRCKQSLCWGVDKSPPLSGSGQGWFDVRLCEVL